MRACVYVHALCLLAGRAVGSSSQNKPATSAQVVIPKHLLSLALGASMFCAPMVADAAGLSSGFSVSAFAQGTKKQSAGWELVRKKRTQAIKEMESLGIVKVKTDDVGNQFLALPWLPDRQVPYKSLPLSQRLVNEVCAGAFGEISKDVLLHAVDTLKTRRQAAKKTDALPTNTSASEAPWTTDPLGTLKGLYAGFPIVFISSIPQGGAFFLVKKSVIEGLAWFSPGGNAVVEAVVPIVFGVMAYWAFRTPAEVIKTQVQTRQSENVIAAIDEFKGRAEGLKRLWRYYPVMLWLDVPFQVLNFALLTTLSDAVRQAGVPTTILSRLVCGVTCGVISAAVTCPIDVCKTRILARDKAALAAQAQLKRDTAWTPATLVLDTVAVEGENRVSSARYISVSDSADTVGPVGLMERAPQLTDELLMPALETAKEVVCTAAQETVQQSQTSEATGDNGNVLVELMRIYREEGIGTLFLGLRPRLIYTGLANGIRLAAYGTSRMDLMMRSLDNI